MHRYRYIMMSGALASIALLASTASANANSEPSDFAFSPANLRWQGFYMGMQAGWNKSRGKDGTSGTSLNGNSVAAGLHGGYNWQRQNLVFGLEMDADLLGLAKKKSKGPFSESLLTPLASLRGRIGHSFGDTLVYATGGVSLGLGMHKTGGSRKAKVHPGWVVGGGVERALSDRWSLRGEYLYANYGKKTYGFSTGNRKISYDDTHTLRVGLSYKF